MSDLPQAAAPAALETSLRYAPQGRALKVFLLAGELSGDRLGAAAMAGLRQLAPNVEFAGVGGPLMQAEGLTSLFPMDELSVMGIAEVLPKYRSLLRRMHETAEAVIRFQPDVLLTIDSPDFCLRVAREVKRRRPSQHVCHYVAPSVWAWRPGRAAKMARQVDQVLCLLPFEPPYMQAAGMRADFVGHPVVSEPRASAEEVASFRASEGIGAAPILLVLPGSRRGEVARLLPRFGQAIAPILQARPDLRVVVPTVAPVAEAVLAGTRDWPGRPVVLDPRGLSSHEATARKRAAFAAAGQRLPQAPGAALAASGTVSLELAANLVPMVVAYDMAWLSWQIMSRLARVDTVTLVNLVSGSKVVPEFLGPACQPGPVGAALSALLSAPEAAEAQITAMQQTMIALGEGGAPPGLRAAEAVLAGWAEKQIARG